MVSVVIPSYNHAHFLKMALQSIIDQKYTNWEAFVVDNHSEDNTDDVVNSFKDKRIKLLKIHNKGVIAASRNLGIRYSRGEWVAFLDSDDWWYPEKLELSVRVLKNGAQLVCHAENWIHNNKIMRVVKYGPKNNANFKNLLFGKNCISTSAVTVLRHSLISVGGFTENPKAIGVEDYHLWLKLAKANYRIEFIDQVLGCYRIHNKNQSNDLLNQMRAEQWVLEHHFKTLTQMSVLEHILRLKRIGHLYASITMAWVTRGVGLIINLN